MDPPNPNPNPNPASMRVLIRPPPPSHSSPSPQAIPIPSSSDPPSTDGVLVVGFIGRSTDDSAQLINRILDFSVFGSGNRDKTLGLENEEELREWLKWRRVSYYHEEQKGILFLRFSSTLCSAVDGGLSDSGSGFDSVFEEHEFGDLQGMLFMFSKTAYSYRLNANWFLPSEASLKRTVIPRLTFELIENRYREISLQ